MKIKVNRCVCLGDKDFGIGKHNVDDKLADDKFFQQLVKIDAVTIVGAHAVKNADDKSDVKSAKPVAKVKPAK